MAMRVFSFFDLTQNSCDLDHTTTIFRRFGARYSLGPADSLPTARDPLRIADAKRSKKHHFKPLSDIGITA